MMWNANGMNGWGYAVMAVSNLLFLGVLAVGFVALMRYLNPVADRRPRTPSTPEQVLADRYAHGVIDEEEGRRRLDVLRASASGLATV